jgi:tetratricopeptide (TPR) repeat protein
MGAPFEYQYRAFISYCHADTSWANWLHGRLEGFRIDEDLIGRQTAMGVIPKTLRPIFRDRDDFTAGHSLSEQTLAALDASAVLILLCSPASTKSYYVNEEVRLFKLRHPDRPIIPIILDGAPGEPVAECFPPALRFEVAADGAITDRPANVIAADLRNTSDGRDLALAKVVAGMLGVPTDDVRKRLAIAQSWRIKVIAALVTVVAVLSLVAGFLVWEHNREVAVDEVREKGRVAREVERDKQIAEMHSLVQNLLGISVAQAAPGAAKALGDAVTDAQVGAAQGDERQQKALDLLKAGKPQDAEPLFRAVAEERAAQVRTDKARLEKDSKAAAAAYRNLGAIAGLGDPKHAREAYAKALEFDVEDLEALYWYGYLNALAGDLGTAQRSLDRLLETATARGDPRGIHRAHLVLSQVSQGRGSLSSARDHAEKALAIALGHSDTANDNLEWQDEVSRAQMRIGNVLRAQGDLSAALDNYRAAHEIRESLVRNDPGNTGWQRDLSVSHNNFGTTYRAQGNLAAALDSYKAAQAIRERLARTDPGNAGWQNDLAASHNNIGGVLRAQGDLAAALDSYKAAQAIREGLVKTDPGNASWQNDLANSDNNVGLVLRAQGNLAAALDSFRAAQAIWERLVKVDAGNTGWLNDSAYSYHNIGLVLRDQGNLAAALDNHKTAQAIRERLVKTDPGNTDWQNNLAASHSNIGDLLRAQGNLPAALDSYKAAQAIRERLATIDPGNAGWQRDLAVSFGRVALIQSRQGARDLALSGFRNGRDILVRLNAQSPGNASLRSDLGWFESQIAALSVSR